MAKLEFYPLGTDPEVEAVRTQQLYFDSGVDEFVREEFAPTVDAYTTLPVLEIAQRLRCRYAGDGPVAYGALPIYGGTDIGMVVWGKKDFKSIETQQDTPGVNVSAWLLRQYRGQGFGPQVIEHATNRARVLGEESGRQVWTSIKPENKASRRSCEHAGFVEVGPQPDKPGRLLYIVQSS